MDGKNVDDNRTRIRKALRLSEIIETFLKDYRNSLGEISLNLTIFGAGFPKGKECWQTDFDSCKKCSEVSCNAKKRKYLKDKIEKNNLADVIFMEEIKFIYPGMEEEIFLKQTPEFDLILLFSESPGSISEFIQFSKKPYIASRIRLFVKPEYHPLYTDEGGVVRDEYLAFLTEYGHVYSYRSIEEAWKIIKKLLTSFRILKYKKTKKDETIYL